MKKIFLILILLFGISPLSFCEFRIAEDYESNEDYGGSYKGATSCAIGKQDDAIFIGGFSAEIWLGNTRISKNYKGSKISVKFTNEKGKSIKLVGEKGSNAWIGTHAETSIPVDVIRFDAYNSDPYAIYLFFLESKLVKVDTGYGKISFDSKNFKKISEQVEWLYGD